MQDGPTGGGANERGGVDGRVAQLEEEVRQRDRTIRELQVGGAVRQVDGLVGGVHGRVRQGTVQLRVASYSV